MAKIVIFGNQKMAQLVHFYFKHDSEHEIAAFTVDEAYIKEKEFQGLPLVAFEEIEKFYPPDEYKMITGIAYKKLNRVRTEKYAAGKAKGYEFISYISTKSIMWGDTKIGENCFIFENQVIQPFVTIGNNVIVWSGNHFGHDVVVEDNCFIGSHVILCGGSRVCQNSFIGVNVTLRDDVSIGKECIIGAGVVVLRNVDDKVVLIVNQVGPYRLDSEQFERMMDISQRLKK